MGSLRFLAPRIARSVERRVRERRVREAQNVLVDLAEATAAAGRKATEDGHEETGLRLFEIAGHMLDYADVFERHFGGRRW